MAENKNARDRDLKVGGDTEPTTWTASGTLTPDNIYNDVVVPASGSITLNLPPPQTAKGRRFYFRCVSDLGGTGVIVQDQDDAIVSSERYTSASNGLTAKGDKLCVESDGYGYAQIYATLT